jgi:hypothetical protein
LLEGLKNSIFLYITEHYVFNSNLWTQIYIVNGAFGIERDIIYPLNKNLIYCQKLYLLSYIKDFKKNWIPVNLASAYRHVK